MDSFLYPFVHVFNYTLQPIPPFSWFSLNVSTLDVLAAFRLCLALRQIRELLYSQHLAKHGKVALEENSLVRSVFTTLTVVYGGETMTGPLLGVPPSYVLSGVFPSLFAAMQAVIDLLPVVPSPSLHTELPLALLDGFTRAMLLCSLIPPAVTANTSSQLASSPWTLLLTSLITANGGFFLANLFSFLHPTSLTLTTPPELSPYGWTATDIWCAPLVTGLYALLTHAQPFWAEAHTFLTHLFTGGGNAVLVAMGNGHGKTSAVDAVDADTARAACAMLLSVMFVVRALKNFGGQWKRAVEGETKKVKMQ